MIRKHFRESQLAPRMIGKTFSGISAGTPDNQKTSHPLTLDYRETFQGLNAGTLNDRKTFTGTISDTLDDRKNKFGYLFCHSG